MQGQEERGRLCASNHSELDRKLGRDAECEMGHGLPARPVWASRPHRAGSRLRGEGELSAVPHLSLEKRQLVPLRSSVCEQCTCRTQVEGRGPAPRPTPTANSEGAAGRLRPPFFEDVKVSERERAETAPIWLTAAPPHAHTETQSRRLWRGQAPLVSRPCLWRTGRVINRLIDRLSSYPKHDLKNKIKFAIYHLCQDMLMSERPLCEPCPILGG